MGCARLPTWIPLLVALAPGCVLAVEDRFSVEEHVDRIVLELDHGSVRIEPATSGKVEVEAELGGVGSTDYGHELIGGVLYIDYACDRRALCGGDVLVRAPSRVDLEVAVKTGDVSVRGMAGQLRIDVQTGEIRGERLSSREVELSSKTGDVHVALSRRPTLLAAVVSVGDVDLDVPAGAYFLQLDAGTGKVRVDGVSHDPEAEGYIVAVTGAGSIRVDGR